MKIHWAPPGLLVLMMVGLPVAAREKGSIGSLRTLQGPVFLIRDGVERAITRPERLFEGDTLRTGANGSVGLLLKDDTSIALGPNSRVAVEQFRFVPTAGRLGLVVRCFKGTMAFISGLVAKLSPESVRVETPVATVGIRGTSFLVKAEEE